MGSRHYNFNEMSDDDKKEFEHFGSCKRGVRLKRGRRRTLQNFEKTLQIQLNMCK